MLHYSLGGNLYRKSKEIHKARLYLHNQIVSLLEASGFQISLFKQYDDLNFMYINVLRGGLKKLCHQFLAKP
jgi:hypothetical protein